CFFLLIWLLPISTLFPYTTLFRSLMTLDGFVEGPNRDISWHSDVWGKELEQLSIEQLNAAGGLLFGRVTYELMANYWPSATGERSEEHTSELQSRFDLVCRLLLEK